jgi:hypothetical protein
MMTLDWMREVVALVGGRIVTQVSAPSASTPSAPSPKPASI